MDNMMVNNMLLLNRSKAQESRDKENIFSLPVPSDGACQHSDTLLSLIIDTIDSKAEGFISFAEYMHLALFAPGLGYYSAGNQKFGASGDFVTAPEISPLFSQCIAQQCFQTLEILGEDACLLEIGAGSGQMAADILKELQILGRLPKYYYILELSAELRERQQKAISIQCSELFSLVHWLDELPKDPIKAMILANEVCDAMPVHRFCLRTMEIENKKSEEENEENKLKAIDIIEMAVAHQSGKLYWVEKPPATILRDELKLLLKDIDKTCHFAESSHYHSEINLNIKPWINSLAEILEAGIILIIDYGFPRHEFYHPSRSMGTLMCHYRHYAHSDPFFYPGLQDITAHVDFTLIAEAALAAKLEVMGFTNQASFLLGSDLLGFAEKNKRSDMIKKNMTEQDITEKGISETVIFKQNQAIQLLTSPAEMGELFKVMALSKSFDVELTGFALNDMRYRL